MAETKISVRSDLLKIAEDLKMIAKASEDTGRSLGEATKEVAKTVNDQAAIVNGGLNKIKNFGKNLVRELGSDFKALFAVNALASGLKLNEQFRGTVSEAIKLNDVMRQLGPVFNMSQAQGEKFKSALVKDLAEIGASSEDAANALQGLGTTGITNQDALKAYATTATKLAGITGQRGQEGAISGGLAEVVKAQGGNINDPKAMARVAEDIVRIRNATGASATDALRHLQDLYQNVDQSLKGRLTSGGAVSLAAAELKGGSGATAFLKRYLGMNQYERAGLQAQGLGKLTNAGGGLDAKALEQAIKNAKGLGGGSAEFGLQAMGLSAEEAKGLIRLNEAMKESGDAIEKAKNAVVDINEEFDSTKTLGEAFRGNLNKLKGSFQSLMDALGVGGVANKVTNALVKTSHSTAGSAAVVGGGALAAAILAGGGLRALGGSLGIGGIIGGEAKAKAIEAVTGEHVQRVEVINWPSSLGGLASAAGGAGGMFGGIGGALGKAGLYAGVAAAGIGAGAYLSDKFSSATEGTGLDKALTDLTLKFSQFLGLMPQTVQSTKDVRVVIDTKDKSLKSYTPGNRGPSQ